MKQRVDTAKKKQNLVITLMINVKTVVTQQNFTIDRTAVSGIMDSAKNPRNKIIQTGMIIVKNRIGMVTIIFKRYVEPYLL